MNLDAKLLTEKKQMRYWILSTNDESTVDVFKVQRPQNNQ